ncbi:hypothetical protein [Streptomyces sp. NPDC088785]|uniref:hypothetical protein n=1 Tax=Streptomyces sp. NPDC088785 TaxID=3365897 RepID=UPI003819D4E5
MATAMVRELGGDLLGQFGLRAALVERWYGGVESGSGDPEQLTRLFGFAGALFPRIAVLALRTPNEMIFEMVGSLQDR